MIKDLIQQRYNFQEEKVQVIVKNPQKPLIHHNFKRKNMKILGQVVQEAIKLRETPDYPVLLILNNNPKNQVLLTHEIKLTL